MSASRRTADTRGTAGHHWGTVGAEGGRTAGWRYPLLGFRSVGCSPAVAALVGSAHRRAACRTQRRTVPGCTPTSPATSPTGRPTPTSPTARARVSNPYGHPTRGADEDRLEGSGTSRGGRAIPPGAGW